MKYTLKHVYSCSVTLAVQTRSLTAAKESTIDLEVTGSGPLANIGYFPFPPHSIQCVVLNLESCA